MEKKGLILGWHQRYLLDDMHVELIRNGFKDKACSMPISALGLDIVCEFLYSIDGFFPQKNLCRFRHFRFSLGFLRCGNSCLLA
ncbi:hypothetical protein GT859_01855 [Bifidobacterium pseudocatenulatum]|jgi:hypothetical protein|uniref:Uncharacterized protein n=1 Tax=Bifidobacterium pseudocatenulatum DSM 20438 = JCM 1200 = LMG 10505 TaxID=547043 RepID=C0BTB9_BIFPS|nr:hypothetical protein BIFPSEUDO_03642 [Bifidobacterium pseudocatenulatum DSM 20438 = JCM 1200 = LMG 10505]MDB6529096.1 hypothetical protein [Bifidobacterium pseudocatenulatum]MZM01348.1 hypothetical protein [Bifidobacterium pseudocatenulatum]MZM31632.1 hypothetical protein [Bifidobacterium pseudocatenulatum]MZN04206.1 hypothetical protein [Bifidobacterium pseudocatenulatum]